MAFKFRSRQVVDRLAQQNFEQLAGVIDDQTAATTSQGASITTINSKLTGVLVGKTSIAGQASLTFPGAASRSNVVTVTHSFGVVALVVATAHDMAAVDDVAIGAMSPTTSSFQLRARTFGSTPALGTVLLIDYIAWVP